MANQSYANNSFFGHLLSLYMSFYPTFVGKYYVVDAVYPNRPSYLALIRVSGSITCRSGIDVWNQKNPKSKFCRIHSSIRYIIERSFRVLKMKWQILYKMPNYPMWKQKKWFLHCCCLYGSSQFHS